MIRNIGPTVSAQAPMSPHQTAAHAAPDFALIFRLFFGRHAQKRLFSHHIPTNLSL